MTAKHSKRAAGKQPRERKYSWASIGALFGLIVAMAVPVSAGGGAVKVSVCHVDGTGTYRLISVSENAHQTHVDHGDTSPGHAVPDQPGKVFDENCEAVPAPETHVVDGYFSNTYSGNLLTTNFSVNQTWDDSYTGSGSYSYSTNSWTIDISDACVDEAGKRATVIGERDTGEWLLLTIKDNGNGTFSTRAVGGATEASLAAVFAQQCGATAIYPASGSTGYLTFS